MSKFFSINILLLGFIVLIAVSCGKSIESPDQLVSKAELSLQQAEAGHAREVAPLEMRIAREKLEEAKKAMRNENYKEAKYLAELALSQAQLAASKAGAVTAKKNVEETEKNLNALRKEANDQ